MLERFKSKVVGKFPKKAGMMQEKQEETILATKEVEIQELFQIQNTRIYRDSKETKCPRNDNHSKDVRDQRHSHNSKSTHPCALA